MLGETVWVDRNLKSAWDRIAAEVPEAWMPRVLEGDAALTRSQGKRKWTVEEFACGHYGCVMPTSKEGLVIKLTSDVAEARFVVMAKTLPESEGIVEYEKIYALRDQLHKGRPLFVLWRSEAFNVGFLRNLNTYMGRPSADQLAKYGLDEHQVHALREGKVLLDKFLKSAGDVRLKLGKLLKERHEERNEILSAVWASFENANPEANPKHYRGIPRLGILLRQCWGWAMGLANTDVLYPVGAALGHYMDDGILLADVHTNNIGQDAEGQSIITDPGHAVEFNPRWTELPRVPVI